MMSQGDSDRATGSGDNSGLIAAIYDDLRRLAAAYLDRERADHTLQPTALVHEAYLKLGPLLDQRCADATHFRAVVATAMRQILVDHARGRSRQKRGGGALRITLSGIADPQAEDDMDVVALDEALTALARFNPRKAQVVELRFFGGMTCVEAAQTLNISAKTAEADWYMARAWLRQAMTQAAP